MAGQSRAQLTAVLVGLGHLGKLFQFPGTVLFVALSFPLLTGLKPLLDNVDNFLINFAKRKRNKYPKNLSESLILKICANPSMRPSHRIPRKRWPSRKWSQKYLTFSAVHLLVPSPLHFRLKNAQDVLLLALRDVWHSTVLPVVVIIPVFSMLLLNKL